MGTLRQLMYPKEFRIKSKRSSAEMLELWKRFGQLRVSDQFESERPQIAQASAIPDATLADLGTSLWRIQQRMIDRETGIPTEEHRRTFRHLQVAWDGLAGVGLRILDHTREIVPEVGIYSLKAIAYEPTVGLLRETVIETVKPTIYFQDRMIQMGEVIIGTPTASLASE
jgi:hypothetical protein